MTGYLLDLMTLWVVFAVAATVVASLVENAGFVHVGAAGFMGIGAYTAALLSTRAGLDPQLALLATLPVGMAAGAVLHFVVGRLSGDVLALATLAVGIVVHGVMLNAVSLTGGPMGIAGIPPRLPLTNDESLDALLFLAITIAVLAVIRERPLGIRFRALREDEALADDLELRPARLRAGLWMGSSAVLSFAGGLLAFHFRYIDPSSFTVRESVGILAMALLIPRPLHLNASIGALVFIALPEILRFIGLSAATGAEIRQLIFGAALLVVVARTRGTMSRPIATGKANA